MLNIYTLLVITKLFGSLTIEEPEPPFLVPPNLPLDDETKITLQIDTDLEISIQEDNVIVISKPDKEENEGVNEHKNNISNEDTNEEGNVEVNEESKREDNEDAKEETVEEPIQEHTEEEIDEPPEQSINQSNWTPYEFTHYTADCVGCSGITSTGVDVRKTTHFNGKRVVAVNPDVIPYDTELEIRYPDGTTEQAIAKDTGGAIRARTDLIDVLVSTNEEALTKGRVNGQIRIVK